ncbi:hypothetical protein [Aquabacterium humicola]|uniref:hypothetical protein n=1 Tax=Aquabacterium humicola TaxID=3237377 RepID=UPI002542C82B|nr:hypothetical protein [Rubrivivax pictus]
MSEPTLRIVPIAPAHAAGFHACLDTVAREKRYLAQIEALPLDRIEGFVRDSVRDDAVQFVALDELEARQRDAMRFDGIYFDALRMSLVRR